MKRILLAVDDSDSARGAAAMLARFVHKDPIDVKIISVTTPHHVQGSYLTNDILAQLYNEQTAAANENLRSIVEMFEGADASVTSELIVGPLYQSILKQAEDFNADLIALGATGQSNLSRMMLGSTSDYIATHAPCSVLIVRPNLDRPAGPFRIGIAYDNDDQSQQALEEITQLTWKCGTEFHVVTVDRFLRDVYGEIDWKETVTQERQALLQRAKEQLDQVASGVETHLFGEEHIGETIVKFAQKQHIDLLVLGEHKRSAMARLFLGSTSRHVLRYAPCSVLLSRTAANGGHHH